MSIRLRALVDLELDGVEHAAGEVLQLPEEQRARAVELVAYGYATVATAEPMKKTRRKTGTGS